MTGGTLDPVAPARRLAAFRLWAGGFAVTYLVVRLPHLWGLPDLGAGRWDPPAGWDLLAAPPTPGLARALVVVTIVVGVAATAGWRYRWTGPGFALLLLATLGYRTAWGNLFHTDNLLVLHVLVLALAPAADAWSLDARTRDEPAPDGRYGWPLRLAALVTVATYVVAGVAKVRYGGLDWLHGDTLLHQVAFDNARKVVLGDGFSPLAATVIGHPVLFAPLGVVTLAVELGAPVALLGRRWALGWSGAAWLFHVGIAALMWIAFPYPLSGIAFAPLLACERPIEAVLGRVRIPSDLSG